MKQLWDTSALVAVLIKSHPRHATAIDRIKYSLQEKDALFISSHSLAELYAVLTRLPLKPMIAPTIAYKLIRDTVLANFTVIESTSEDYMNLLESTMLAGHRGGIIYDGLIARAAAKTDVDRLITLNKRHFDRVWPEGLHRIHEP